MGLLSDGFGIRQVQNQIGPESVDTGRPVADIETAKPELSSVINISDVIDASKVCFTSVIYTGEGTSQHCR
jgi:hypothetical protein